MRKKKYVAIYCITFIYIIPLLNHTDSTSGSVQQPEVLVSVQPQEDTCSQPLTFSKDMNNIQLAQWLRNYPSLTGTYFEEDISKLIGL